MMKRINPIELFVLVVFFDLLAASPPVLSGSDSSLMDDALAFYYPLNYFWVESQSTETKKYDSSHIDVKVYDDTTKFDYSLVTSEGEHVLDNNGQNTAIVFLFNTKMTIHAKDNVNVLYSLEFKTANRARLFANRIVSTIARYNQCTDSNTYKLKEVYERSAANRSVLNPTGSWCIFKDTISQTNVTTFMVKWIGPIDEYRDPLCVLRPGDFRLTRVPNKHKFELSVSLNRQTPSSTYVLETSTPDDLEEFFA